MSTNKNFNMLLAGFGGQGILFAGKVIAYGGLMDEKEISWLPSYGPEMRGGTANCSVIISDEGVGSPIVNKPDILVAMNLPSLDKYETEAVPGAVILVDSSLIQRKVARQDVKAYYIPATKMASDAGIPSLANMILMGYLIAKTGAIPFEIIDQALKKVVSAKHQDKLEVNRKAIELGYHYHE